MSQHRKTLFPRGAILKPTERTQVILKNNTRDFQNSPQLDKSAYFYVSATGNFERF